MFYINFALLGVFGIFTKRKRSDLGNLGEKMKFKVELYYKEKKIAEGIFEEERFTQGIDERNFRIKVTERV